jgi:hypothetical protein
MPWVCRIVHQQDCTLTPFKQDNVYCQIVEILICGVQHLDYLGLLKDNY